LIKSTLIVNESTSYPGTLRNFIKPIIEAHSVYTHHYAAAPERIDPGNQTWNVLNTPRVIGGLTEEAQDLAESFYRSFCANIFPVRSPEVAEAAKLFENTFRQVNIALANEFSIISSRLGFSTHEAIEAASTKPFGFMPFFPGIGVGGHCIPVDPCYLSFAARKAGTQANFIELANFTNLKMINYVIDKIKMTYFKDLSKVKIPMFQI
jgi:UDP-N-acetyl-D-glucosamine dehydrogenase